VSDLQIGLAMLGVLVVASVLLFNWWQERQFRRRAGEPFSNRHEDILMEAPAASAPVARSAPRADDERIEPSMEPRMEPQLEAAPSPAVATMQAPMPAPTPGARAAAREDHPLPQSEVDYIVEIRAGDFIGPDAIRLLQQRLAAVGRRAMLGGFDYQANTWGALQLDAPRHTAIRAAVQLVDRTGPVTREQLQRFGEAMKEAANEMGAIAELPEFAPALAQAGELDEFCADVDVVVGINVIARTGQVFHGTKIRALAESAGLQLRADGVFHMADELGLSQFSLDNQEAEPFLADRIRNLTTPGITLLFDVPRVAHGVRAFDRMVAVGRGMADSLDGMLADDNRVLLNDGGLDKIRNQLRSIYAAMEHRGIPPGSPLALRLFS
jgi:FtsZ-interacting cell division protein ZipA